jgi:hypothetical protein
MEFYNYMSLTKRALCGAESGSVSQSYRSIAPLLKLDLHVQYCVFLIYNILRRMAGGRRGTGRSSRPLAPMAPTNPINNSASKPINPG